MTDTIVTVPNSAPRVTLFLLAGLAALGEFAVTAYIPAITIIADDLGVRTEMVQTTVSVGLVTGAIAGLVIGAVADSMRRRQLLFPALGLFIVGSVFAAAAPSISWLFIGRVFQAVGACAGIILSRAIARDFHSGPQLTRLLSGVTLVFRWHRQLLLFLEDFLLHGSDGERSSHSRPATGALYLSACFFCRKPKRGWPRR
jgi:DHA1 family bicyclomycin/chloramphenicol resistance-like MFS transporter